MLVKALTWCVHGLALLLALGFLGPWFHPADSLAQFRHVLVALLFASALLSALLRLRTARTGLLTVFVVVVLTYPHVPWINPSEAGAGSIRLVQFNVRFHNARQAEAAAWIAAQKPDVLMLQEYSEKDHPDVQKLAGILPHRINCKSAGLGDVAVFTRFPLLVQHCGAEDGLVWVQALVDGKAITFASLHLKWPWPYGQWQQLQRLQSVFAAIPKPIVLAGDHNAVPWSASVKEVERLTGSAVISGYRTTLRLDVFHDGKPLPVLPIDHVLLPESTTIRKIWVGPDIGSDHLPVVVEFDPP